MSDMAANKLTKVPTLVYGTAWKKERSRALVHQALKAGFKGVDTAAQPKHYEEKLVGEGIRDAIGEGVVKREDLYIQTKYTSIHGQDPNRMPYDSKLSIADQVTTTIASSLHNFRPADNASESESYIDCLVLHAPFPNMSQTQEAWSAMEQQVPSKARTLGISNMYRLSDLQTLYQFAKVPPSVVQNRFYPETHFDVGIREFCREKGIVYQSFWTLTANPGLLRSQPVKVLAEQAGVSVEVALYGLVLGLGERMCVLDGTTNAGRMEEDVEGVQLVEEWAMKEPEAWKALESTFKGFVNR